MQEIPPKKKTAEYLGPVKLNNGQFTAEMRRELDPNGAIVAHAVRKSPYVHERWHSQGKLDPDLFTAAERFRLDFERAGLQGSYARLDLWKVRSGPQEMSDRTALANIRTREALNALGRGNDSPSVSCVWSVVGQGLNLDQWTQLYKREGSAMNADRAGGVLHSSLERLALHYGILTMSQLGNIGSDASFGRGVKATVDFVSLSNIRPLESAEEYFKRLKLGLQKRFAKHLS